MPQHSHLIPAFDLFGSQILMSIILRLAQKPNLHTRRADALPIAKKESNDNFKANNRDHWRVWNGWDCPVESTARCWAFSNQY